MAAAGPVPSSGHAAVRDSSSPGWQWVAQLLIGGAVALLLFFVDPATAGLRVTAGARGAMCRWSAAYAGVVVLAIAVPILLVNAFSASTAAGAADPSLGSAAAISRWLAGATAGFLRRAPLRWALAEQAGFPPDPVRVVHGLFGACGVDGG